MNPLAQSPDERFDLVDARGNSLGVAKRRGDVHRDGDWHRAVHLWVVNAEGPRAWVVLQRRSLAKDTWPGRVDVSVAGHLASGETADDALREADEEIGLVVTPAQTKWLGRAAKRLALPDGGCDNEILDVYATRTARAFESLRPHPAEVAALLAVDLDEALALWAGACARAPARSLSPDGVVTATAVHGEDLCAPDGGLRARSLAAVRAWLAGEPLPPWPALGAT